MVVASRRPSSSTKTNIVGRSVDEALPLEPCHRLPVFVPALPAGEGARELIG
jgi:hypothetical protein